MPYVDAKGVKLFYESAGEGPPIILQAHHHLPWMYFSFPFFSEHGYHVFTFDRRGTGRSDSPPAPWTTKDFADDCANMMDALSIDKAIIGGASLGGIITSQMGLDYPEKCKALLICNTSLYFWEIGNQWVQSLIDHLKAETMPDGRQPKSFEWEDKGPWGMNPEFAKSHIGTFISELRGGLGQDPDSAIKALEAAKGWDQRPRAVELQAIKIPTLILVGGNEPQMTIQLAYEWHKLIPKSEFIILPETHHSAVLENPTGWHQAVYGFLKRHGL